MRVRTFTVLAAVLLTFVGPPADAGAQEGDVDCTTTTIPGGAVGIGNGLAFNGGQVFDPDGSPARTFDAYQAAVFVQSWLGTSIYGGPEIERESAPEGAPVHRIDITGIWAGGGAGAMTIYYATDGGAAYIAFPQDQVPRADGGGTVPSPADWFIALPRVTDAFNGEAELTPTQGTCETAPASDGDDGTSSASPDAGDDGMPGWVFPAAIAGAAVVAGGLLLRWRRSPGGG